MIANYHTHTWRCGHSEMVADEAIVQQAIKSGLKVLGFSDHSPWPYETPTNWPNVRMTMEQLPQYLESVRQLKEKYKDQIRIYVGLECEYYPAYMPWLQSVRDQLDYVIFGNHFPRTDEHGTKHFQRSTTAEEVQRFYDTFQEAMQTDWFCYVAHPEIGLRSYPVFDNVCIDGSYALCRRAKQMDKPLEYNLYGAELHEMKKHTGLGYPCHQFWEIAKEVGCKAIIGGDVHWLRHLQNTDAMKRAEDYLTGMGLELLQTLPGLD